MARRADQKEKNEDDVSENDSETRDIFGTISNTEEEEERNRNIRFLNDIANSESEDASKEENENDVLFERKDSSDQESDSEERSESEHSDKQNEKSTHFPFPNMETALIYLWAHSQPRLSKHKIQALLDVLHTPGFTIENVPKITHHLQKHKQRLPSIQTS